MKFPFLVGFPLLMSACSDGPTATITNDLPVFDSTYIRLAEEVRQETLRS